MKHYVASDHAGVAFKAFVKSFLEGKGVEVEDLGPATADRVDYPDYAMKVVEKVHGNPDALGILICGTGIGMSLAANKFKGIRATLCHDAYTAKMAKAHNDANILVMGARVLGEGTAESILEAWLNTGFEGGRHGDRIAKVEEHGDVL